VIGLVVVRRFHFARAAILTHVAGFGEMFSRFLDFGCGKPSLEPAETDAPFSGKPAFARWPQIW
jgi:hypothetical protein